MGNSRQDWCRAVAVPPNRPARHQRHVSPSGVFWRVGVLRGCQGRGRPDDTHGIVTDHSSRSTGNSALYGVWAFCAFRSVNILCVAHWQRHETNKRLYPFFTVRAAHDVAGGRWLLFPGSGYRSRQTRPR